MPKTDHQRSMETLEKWILEEILKYRARFVHVCYKTILPPELYALAKENKEMARCSQWANDNGWKFAQKGESLLLLKDRKVIGEFRPMHVGGKADPSLQFYAQIAGQKIELVQPDESSPEGITDAIMQMAQARNN
jgi:hypothetical protein